MEDAFGTSAPWSLGVEEELMLVDGSTMDLADRAEEIVERAARAGLEGRVKLELFATVVEVTTGVCTSVAEAARELGEARSGLAALAGELDLTVMASGTHPIARPEEQRVSREERYAEFVRIAGISALRQGVNGLHVHVGMPSADACYAALEGVLPWLPVILALSANSPYLAGAETGLASSRAELLAHLPRSAAPPAFADYADWAAFVERLQMLGVIDDYTRIWWDVRPHPRLGTLEIRMPDQPTALDRSVAFTALLQALCATAARLPTSPHDPPGRALYAQNRWAALSSGLGAQFVHPDGDRVVAARDAVADLLALVAPAARELGVEELISVFDGTWCEGDRQLEVGRAGGLHAVCDDLVRRSLAFP